jgi:hypothetical protein
MLKTNTERGLLIALITFMAITTFCIIVIHKQHLEIRNTEKVITHQVELELFEQDLRFLIEVLEVHIKRTPNIHRKVNLVIPLESGHIFSGEYTYFQLETDIIPRMRRALNEN